MGFLPREEKSCLIQLAPLAARAVHTAIVLACFPYLGVKQGFFSLFVVIIFDSLTVLCETEKLLIEIKSESRFQQLLPMF